MFVPAVLAQPTQADVRRYDIPDQSLLTAVREYGRISGVQVVFQTRIATDLRGNAVRGELDAEEALRRLLAGTGLAARRIGNGTVALEATQPVAAQGDVLSTDALSVSGDRGRGGGAARDQRGYDDVYDLDVSTSYIGRAEVERYKGKTPSDLVNGVPGVFSGDARNSGALDLNIRGIQGRGRVPVLIDGTEQALTVWRGYNGATNRNYIDPFLIGGIQIVKGPAMVRNVSTGVGGAMVVKTLDVDDIVSEGTGFGGEFRVEGSSNAVAPRLPTLHTGEDYRTVDGYPQNSGITPNDDLTLRVAPRTGGGGYDVFGGEDYAYRLALGWKSERVDLLGAYAYRERGNYYAGKRNAGYYSHEQASWSDDVISWLATRLPPGNEMTNTSSQMESWLFKATWRPTDDQQLELGYRDSLSHYGEIMPSRLFASSAPGSVQWPLSRVDAQAWNLEYKWQPEDSRWIDLYANLWRTDTLSDTYSAGGFPNYAAGADSGDVVLRNTAIANATNARNGVTLSNKIRFTDALDLTLGGDFQHEKLRSGDVVSPNDGWRSYPRAGRREEWNASFNFDWRPLDWLQLSAGMRYVDYWAYDDYVAANPGRFGNSATVSREASYWTERTEFDQAEYDAIAQAVAEAEANRAEYESQGIDLDALIREAWDALQVRTVRETHHLPWAPDADGKYAAATNPCLNGQFLQDAQQHLQGGATLASINGEDDATYCRTSPINEYVAAVAEKKRGHRWVPAFSATVVFSDYDRAYFRYTEAVRYPSLFESTIGFSANVNPFRSLKPEHAYNWELAYIHDFSHLLSAEGRADVKLAYYSNKTRNVIERDNRLSFGNIDKQTIRGVELTGRYDGGRFFTDLGMNYMLENEVCDASHALLTSIPNGENVDAQGNASDVFLPGCVKYGFLQGYLLTQATPEFSANWSLGGRLLDKRLELGGRVTYYSRYKNADLDFYRANVIDNGGGFLATSNYPYSWGETLLFDAYASYRIREDLVAELSATNLTDQYYIDPATRGLVAAPGRTLKLSLTARF
ncbi:TonB-dependent receptor [Xanthomonas sp.]|uniref:TonB-dependent receptor n=1 Tax=Xanthomonas sp. TaxID=29446 RepID=UPI001F12A09C|nr:TonB-dependent receptor [Xanthomonas sp.]